MTCAIVEHKDGKKTHHTNVVSCGLRMQRNKSAVILVLSDGCEKVIDGAVSGRLVCDDWYALNASRFSH